MSASPSASLFAIYKTFAISLPTVVDALSGRLTPERSDARLHDWALTILRRAEVRLTVEGTEHIPAERACVLMSNHQSHLDVPILFAAYPRRMRMVAKAELFRIPVFGRAMRHAGFVSVDRSGDRTQAMEAMREAGQAMASGTTIWIAPEGTRSPDGKMGRFKKGGFLLARETQALILPLSIDGSRHILPKHARWVQTGVEVRLTFSPPIEAASLPLDELVARVRQSIAAHVSDAA